MNVLIIGATGTIGQQLVSQALEAGHTVTALVRNPQKLALHHTNLVMRMGDVLDPTSLKPEVFQGQDAVLLALGAGAKGQIRARGTQNVIQAMKAADVRRFICLSSLGVGDSNNTLNFFWKYVMFGFLLRKAFADHVLQEQYVRESGLDWTIVRPGAFTDGDITGEYQHGALQPGKLKLKVSRADVAHFMLRQLFGNHYLHQAPGVSY